MARAFSFRGGAGACALLLAGLLAQPNGAHASEPLHALNAVPVPLADNIKVGERVGRLRFLGMLDIPSVVVNGVRLSQLSDIAWDRSAGVLYAISDKGALFHLHPVFRDDILVDVKLSRAVSLREIKTGQPLHYKRADAEGLILMPANGGRAASAELLVSFERFPRIVRYRTDGYAVEELSLPPALTDVKSYNSGNSIFEAMCHDSRYGVLTMPEKPLQKEAAGHNRLYSLNAKSWRYPLTGSDDRVVSLACLGDGEVLILENDFGLRFWHSQVTLKRVRLTEPTAADTPLKVETLFTLAAGEGYQIDNFEGIAHHRGKRFFLISDDNDFFLQRTLLLYFELIEE